MLLYVLGSMFYEFNSFWLNEKPESVMEFNRIKEKFENKITAMLTKDVTALISLKYKEGFNNMGSLTSVNSMDTQFWLSVILLNNIQIYIVFLDNKFI